MELKCDFKGNSWRKFPKMGVSRNHPSRSFQYWNPMVGILDFNPKCSLAGLRIPCSWHRCRWTHSARRSSRPHGTTGTAHRHSRGTAVRCNRLERREIFCQYTKSDGKSPWFYHVQWCFISKPSINRMNGWTHSPLFCCAGQTGRIKRVGTSRDSLFLSNNRSALNTTRYET